MYTYGRQSDRWWSGDDAVFAAVSLYAASAAVNNVFGVSLGSHKPLPLLCSAAAHTHTHTHTHRESETTIPLLLTRGSLSSSFALPLRDTHLLLVAILLLSSWSLSSTRSRSSLSRVSARAFCCGVFCSSTYTVRHDEGMYTC